MHPCNNKHPNRVSNYRQLYNELNFEGFGLTNGFECSDVHKVEKLTNLSINMFEVNFYQYQKKWKHKLTPIEGCENFSDRVVDLLFYKNHKVPNKKSHKFLGNRICNDDFRRCLNSYTSQKVLIKHEQQCGEQDVTSLGLSNETHLY